MRDKWEHNERAKENAIDAEKKQWHDRAVRERASF